MGGHRSGRQLARLTSVAGAGRYWVRWCDLCDWPTTQLAGEVETVSVAHRRCPALVPAPVLARQRPMPASVDTAEERHQKKRSSGFVL